MKAQLPTLTLALLFTLPLSAQKVELPGRLAIHNSKYRTGQTQYVPNAQVSAPFTSPTVTDQEGQFTLTFVGIDRGMKVDVQVEKHDWEVVNAHDLRNVIIGRTDPLWVYLDRAGRLAQSQTEFYRISKAALYAEHNARIAVLEKAGAEAEALIAQLNADLSLEIRGKNEAIFELQQQLAAAEKRLPAFARELATINLDRASDLYIEAYELFRRGAIRQALAVLDEAQLERAARDGQTAMERGQEILDLGKTQVAQTIEAYALKAEGHALLFEFRQAAAAYKKRLEWMLALSPADNLDLAFAYREAALAFQETGDYQRALEYSRHDVQLCTTLLEPRDTLLAGAYSNLAIAQQYLGQYESALQSHQRAVVILEKAHGPDHPNVLAAHHILAGIYHDLGDYQNALLTQSAVFAVARRTYDETDPFLGAVYNSLSLIYGDLGEHDQALIHQQKALAITKGIYPSNHPHVGTSYNNLALIYLDLGNYQAALLAAQQNLDILKNFYTPSHPLIAGSYNNLATIYFGLGEYEAARSVQQKALDILLLSADPTHPSIANAHNNLAVIYGELGDLQNALSEQQKALAIRELCYPPDHPMIAISQHNLAALHSDLGDEEVALERQLKALAIFERVYESPHPKLASAHNSLSTIYQRLGDYQKALAHQRQALLQLHAVYDSAHPHLATSYHNLASIFFDLKAFAEAIEAQERALAIERAVLAPDHPEHQKSLAQLHFYRKAFGDHLLDTQQYAPALQQYQLLYEPNQDPQLANRIAICHYHLADYAQALHYYERAYESQAIPAPVYWNNTGMAQAKLGQFPQAHKCFSELQKLIPDDGLVYRDWCLYYCLKGEADQALPQLEKALRLGYKDLDWLQTEPALAPIRNTERFQRAIASLGTTEPASPRR